MNAKTLKILQVSAQIFIFIGMLILPLTPMQAVAQTPTPSDDEVNRIAEQLFCPVCENVPLDECQTAACEQWCDLIRQKLGEGRKEDEIKAFLLRSMAIVCWARRLGVAHIGCCMSSRR